MDVHSTRINEFSSYYCTVDSDGPLPEYMLLECRYFPLSLLFSTTSCTFSYPLMMLQVDDMQHDPYVA